MKFSRLFVLLAVLTLSASFVFAVVPFGAETVTEENSTRAPIAPASNHSAIAGNVTELTIKGTSITQGWQGYYGNVSGTIELADSDDNIFYNWSLADPEGEVYASTEGSLDWTNVQCFNFNAAGTFADDSANRGGTSAFGMNITQLETFYGMEFDAVDGIDETFGLLGQADHGTTGYTHMEFFTNNLQFHAGECLSTYINGPNGAVSDDLFEEVLLYDPTNQAPIFVALIEEGNEIGFDGRDHDFQMLVPEDGFGTDLNTTTYFFYVELE